MADVLDFFRDDDEIEDTDWDIISDNCRNAEQVKNDCCSLGDYESEDMNCGGYALGTCDWYCPSSFQDNEELECVKEFHNTYGWESCDDEYDPDGYAGVCNALADIYIDDMENDPDIEIREVDGPDSKLDNDERLIAFRASIDDFHYARQMSNGEWTHKRGRCPIEDMSEYTLEEAPLWMNGPTCYGGRTRYLAVREM